jgi:hypothetical protein
LLNGLIDPIDGSGDEEHAATVAAAKSAKSAGDFGVDGSVIGLTFKAIESGVE